MYRTRLVVLVVVSAFSAVSMAACGASVAPVTGDGGAGSSGTSGTVGRTPKVHRAVGETCAMTPPPEAMVPDGGTGNCHSNADCTAGKNGRCQGSRIGFQCAYDACYADSECTTGGPGVCACNAPVPGTSAGSNTECLAANCRIDSDCGAAGFCSPTRGCFGADAVGYYCHTAQDECVDVDDCAAQGGGYCAYEPTVGHWKCMNTVCAG